MEAESIKSDYCVMRTTGVSAREALAKLHPAIVKLSASQRKALFEGLRQWEIKRTTAGLTVDASNGDAATEPDSVMVVCAECRLLNAHDEIFCKTVGSSCWSTGGRRRRATFRCITACRMTMKFSRRT